MAVCTSGQIAELEGFLLGKQDDGTIKYRAEDAVTDPKYDT